MALLNTLIFFLLFLSQSFPASAATPQATPSTHLLDLFIRDYTFTLTHSKNFKTGVLHSVGLPVNLSGITVTMARFRCGSLRRYGVQIKEFSLGIGVSVHPCVERVVLIAQNLGQNWSSSYYQSFNFNGYRLVSPILGLLAYNAVKQSNPFELRIIAGAENPMKIDFSDLVRANSSKWTKTQQAYCASFEEGDGGGGVGRKVVLTGMVGEYVCEARKEGHYGMVEEVGVVPATEVEMGRRVKKGRKVAVGGGIGAAIAAALLGLLVVAMVVRVKKREKRAEMVRKTYEEEALQVSMVGHVRAPVARVTRTWPRTGDARGTG